jgi:cysteine desulfurase
MLANNEMGAVQPLERIGAVTRARGVLLHTDACQGLGKTPFDVERMNVDLASLSGHKIYGPKGVGALYVRGKKPRVRLLAEIDGGGQERSLRSGTVDVPAVVGLGAACQIVAEEGASEGERLGRFRDRLYHTITESLDGVVLNGPQCERLPENLNLSFEGTDSAGLLNLLQRDVALSSGAACTSLSLEPSHVIRAIGGLERARSSLRFGLGRFTTEEEVDFVAERVVAAVRSLRGS